MKGQQAVDPDRLVTESRDTYSARQETAAGATISLGIAHRAGTIRRISAAFRVAAAAGESITVMVRRNNVDALTEVITLDSTVTLRAETVGTIVGAQEVVAQGDFLDIVLTYVAGGGPTPLVGTIISVGIEPS